MPLKMIVGKWTFLMGRSRKDLKMQKQEFFDEQIIDMINQSEQRTTDTVANQSKEECSIENGIKILGKWIQFERRLLAEETISMMIPAKFSPMNPEIAKIKYPAEQRPETILTDETGTINLMFQYMEGEVSNATIETFRNQIFGMMKRVNPGIKEQEIGVIDIAELQTAYVEFSNNVMDGKLYNLMFYLAVNGRPLMGSFNCRTKDMKYWRRVAFDMLQSIQISETED